MAITNNYTVIFTYSTVDGVDKFSREFENSSKGLVQAYAYAENYADWSLWFGDEKIDEKKK